ncbi:MAG: Ig-like domain-containing protein, partial [Nitrospiria bacterium]
MPMTHTATVVSRVAWGIISLAVVIACGGQAPGPEGSGPTGPDTTPPAIQSRYPSAGATLVPPNTIIAVTFTEALDTQTVIAANVSLTQALVGPVQHSLVWDADSNTLKILPATNLREETHYTVTLTDGLKDPAGHQLAPATWAFTTGRTFDNEAPEWNTPRFDSVATRFDAVAVSWSGEGGAAAIDRPAGSSGLLIYTVFYKRSTDPEFFKQNSAPGASGLTITGLKARDVYQFEIQVSDLAGNVSRYQGTIGTVTMPPAGRLYAANYITGAV